MILVQIVAAWFVADFIAGVFHWFEDRYLAADDRFPLFRGIARDNQLHHEKPTAMLLNTKIENIRDSAMVALPLSLLAWFVGFPVWLWLGIALTSLGNLVHRYAHTPDRYLPRWIQYAQRLGLFISKEHHDTHHRDMSVLVSKQHAARAYCPMTDWVNPVLDAIRFWGFLEAALLGIGLQTIDKRMAK